MNWTNLSKSVINTANLNGIGAVCLSIGFGALIGTFIFMIAVLWGTVNKYVALEYPDRPRKKWQDPSITAIILMVATSWNSVEAFVDIFTQSPDLMIKNTALAFVWFCGALGDNAIRVNDKGNFSAKIDKVDDALGLCEALRVAFANPIFFYQLNNVSLSVALLQDVAIDSLAGVAGIIVIILSLGAASYAMYRGYRASHGKIAIDAVNDGVLNYVGAGALCLLAITAMLAGNILGAIAQIIFAGGNITALFETRSRLAREKTA